MQLSEVMKTTGRKLKKIEFFSSSENSQIKPEK